MRHKNIKTISVAESCTGGLISHLITNKPGSSLYFMGAVISYSNESKISLLKVPKIFIKKYGAVSDKVARCMSREVRKLMKSDVGLAVTGIAGPRGGTKKKPIGLVFISVSDKNRIKSRKFLFKGNRLKIKMEAARKAIEFLRENTGNDNI